ncbi:transmembrane protein, putative [Medicago truncatula]|uniref:Transmembrane protein, putative n=1 Tax=Medicago truncatula TaxID=3880 RepID=G8A1T2_MEDTR|nr:transmembrane protein, putative [Medicago truncatula]
MLCGMHNHDLEEKLSGHLLAGRLSAEEKKKVIDITKSLAVPRNILTNLKRKGQRCDMTELQYLISKFVEHQYVYYTRCNSEETTFEDIFFTHPESIKLLNTFPTVLVMDSTYKTNIYRMPLFEIIGCTSTKMMYSVGFVIVTNRDGALMNVVGTTFPETYTMLYFYFIFHIGKNVRATCITDFRVKSKPPMDAKVDKKQHVPDHLYQFGTLGGFSKNNRSAFHLIWLSCVWMIWLERNARVFHQIEASIT